MSRKNNISLVVVSFMLAAPANAQMANGFRDLLDTIHEARIGSSGFFGSTAGMLFADGSSWVNDYGVTGPVGASQGGRILNLQDRFRIGSQTKTYTGTVVLKYVDDGIIGLDDTMQDWVDARPAETQSLLAIPEDRRRAITVRDLLSMRSGLPEYLGAEDPNNPGRTVLDVWNAAGGRYNLTRSELLAASVGAGQTVTPGDPNNFSYSNASFTSLGVIAEAASCQAGACKSIREIITDRVITPLGLANTLYPLSDEFGSLQHTNGTWNIYGNLTDFTATFPSVPNSAGAMVSNLNDQLVWLYELTTNANGTLNPATFAQRVDGTRNITGDVGGIPAGYGLGIYGQYSLNTGAFMIGHGGEISGYQTLMFHYPGDTGDPNDDLYVVLDLNTFLNWPNDRRKPPADIQDVYYDLQRAVSLHREESAQPGGCPLVGGVRVCSGVIVDSSSLLPGDGVDVTFEPSGRSWTNEQTGEAIAMPTYLHYGHVDTALSSQNNTVTIEEGAAVETYGNDTYLIETIGTASTVINRGRLVAIGNNVRAIQASSASDDTIFLAERSETIGDVYVENGNDRVTVNGMLQGDVVLGANARLDGNGQILGQVSGPGEVHPDSGQGLTIARYDANNGTLRITVDGSTGQASRVVVPHQTTLGFAPMDSNMVHGFSIVDTGEASLSGGTLILEGTPLIGDQQIAIIETANGLVNGAPFDTVQDPDGVLTNNAGQFRFITYSANNVVLGSVSSGAFDGTAEAGYRDGLALLDAGLVRARTTAMRPGEAPVARLSFLPQLPGEGQLRRQRFFAEMQGTRMVAADTPGAPGFVLGGASMQTGLRGWTDNGNTFEVAFSKGDFKVTPNAGGQQDISSFGLSGLLGGTVGRFDWKTAAFVGGANVALDRDTGAGTARGHTTQQRWGAALEVGQNFESGPWKGRWQTSLAYSAVSQRGYTESSAPFNVGQFGAREDSGTRIGLGGRLAYAATDDLIPWIEGELFMHSRDGSDNIFVDVNGISGFLDNNRRDGAEMRLSAGVSYTNASNIDFDVRVTHEIAEGRRTSAINAGFSMQF